MKILVSGYLIRKPVAGLAWHYGQYLVGLQRLGHDVLYVEDSEDFPGNVDANLGYAQEVFRYLGLPQDWMFFDFGAGVWEGPAAKSASQALSDADILISLSGPLAVIDGSPTGSDIELAAAIVARYGQGRDAASVELEYRAPNGNTRLVRVAPRDPDHIPPEWLL